MLHRGINAAGAVNVGWIFRIRFQIVRFRKAKVKRGEERSDESVRYTVSNWGATKVSVGHATNKNNGPVHHPNFFSFTQREVERSLRGREIGLLDHG